MARSPLDALVTEKSLQFMSQSSGNRDFLDLVLDGSVEANIPLKNVCAKVVPELAEEIDQVCDLLNISKRRFLEAAFIEAVMKAKSIMQSEGLYEYLEELADEQEKSKGKEAA